MRLVFVLVLVSALLAFAQPASAETTRGCNASIQIRVVESQGAVGARNVLLERFSGRGRCRGRAWATDCRRDARSRINRCISHLWDLRWNPQMPVSCDASRGSSVGMQNLGPLAPGPGNHWNIKRAIERASCCGANDGARMISARVTLRTTGDTGCSGEQVISRGYVSRCVELRRQGICR